MGNCQAVDAATLVIQHPNGRVDKLYWSVNAGEVMKMNPGHYVALLLSTTLYPAKNNGECPNTTTTTTTTTISTSTSTSTSSSSSSSSNNNTNNSLRITRIKLLRPTDTLVLGHAYRLIPTQEVMKGLWAKKQARQKKIHSESAERPERMRDNQCSGVDIEVKRSQLDKDSQVSKNERNRGPRTATAANSGSGSGRSRTWQPSLHSISEAGS